MQVLPHMVRVAVLGLASWLMLVTGRAEESNGGKSMEAFFRARGYEPVKLEVTRNNYLMVEGLLGERKIWCLIDTGKLHSWIDEAYLGNATKLTNFSGVRPGDVSETEISAYALETLKLGRCQFMGQPVDVVTSAGQKSITKDAPTGSRISRRVKNSSKDTLILGRDFLIRNFALIDCNHATLYFRGTAPPAELKATIGESLRRSGFTEIPFEPGNHHFDNVSAKVNDQEVRFRVTTGGFVSTLDREEARMLDLTVQKNLHVAFFDSNGEKQDRLDFAHIRDLQLAGYRAGKFNIAVLARGGVEAHKTTSNLPPLVGTIGMDLLSRDEAIIDCQGGRMFMRSHPK